MPPSINKLVEVVYGTDYADGYAPSVAKGGLSLKQKTCVYGKEGNRGYPHMLGQGDIGHSFMVTGFETEFGFAHVGDIWRGGPLNQHYVGGFAAPLSHAILSGSYPPDARGAEAYNRMKPTKPSFQALNAVYELRELPGMLRQRFLDSGLYSIGDYWLALQFGWKPLLNDIVNLYVSQKTMEKRLKQLLRDNGKPVRRRVDLVNSSSDPVSVSGASYGSFIPTLVTQYYDTMPTFTEKSWQSEHWWASAQFRYWLPDGPKDVNWERALKARLLGLYPSPSVLWNALPWTWCADWFYNVGHVLENMEGGVANRLAADYFYVMREVATHRERYVQGTFHRRDGTLVKASTTSRSTGFSKIRTKGDPFGLNTNQNDLNGMQLSILGALGMSRLR